MRTSWDDTLRAAGLRVTLPRHLVLEALEARPHSDADTILGAARHSYPNLSAQAVYGVLKALVAAGIARRFEPAGASALYELRVADNHHHLVCRRCATVVDVDCAVASAPCLTPSPSEAGADFAVDEAEVIFWGLCADCRSAGDAAPGDEAPTDLHRTTAATTVTPKSPARKVGA